MCEHLYEPQDRMQHQTVRLVQSVDYSILEGPVQACNIDLLLIRIIASPKEVSGDPVYS